MTLCSGAALLQKWCRRPDCSYLSLRGRDDNQLITGYSNIYIFQVVFASATYDNFILRHRNEPPIHKFVAHRSRVYQLINITLWSYRIVDTNVQYQLLYYNKTSRDSHYG